MIYIVGQIWIWLLIALVLGGLLSWLWLRMTAGRRVEDQLSPWRDRVAALERERDTLRREVGEVRDRATESETQLAALREDMQEQEERLQEQAAETRDAAEVVAAIESDDDGRLSDGPSLGAKAVSDDEPAAMSVAAIAPERDNLMKIKGIGRVLQDKLNTLGIETYAQIASLADADIARVNAAIGFNGRIEREDWIGQARALIEARQTPDA